MDYLLFIESMKLIQGEIDSGDLMCLTKVTQACTSEFVSPLLGKGTQYL